MTKQNETIYAKILRTENFRPKVGGRDLSNFTSQLAIMSRSGVDIATALESLARQTKKGPLKLVLKQLHEDVVGGLSFSEALQKQVHVFGPTYVAIVTAGEASGKMAVVLVQLAQLQRGEMKLRGIIRTLLAYPIVLASVSSLVLMGLIIFVLPQFAEIFDQHDMPLPALTQILIGLSEELRNRFWLWIPVILLVIGGGVAFRISEAGRSMWDGFVLNAWLLRDVTRSLMMGRLCRLLGLMIDSGVPLLESLRLVRASVRNSLYQKLFIKLEEDVMNGRGLSNSLLASEFVPPSAAEMVITAERTGTLAHVTQLIGEHFEDEGEGKLREFVTVLEPAITVGMGLIVAVVVLAVMMPMFDMASLAGQGY